MNVTDIMVRTAASCHANANLGEAVEIMWRQNCGVLPVVSEDGKVTGVITDHDICIALGTRHRLPGEIAVKDVAGPHVYFCKPDDDVRAALEMMARAKVRRLPVLNETGRLEGILSMDDVVFHADTASPSRDPSAAAVINTLKAVYSSGLPQRAQRQAA